MIWDTLLFPFTCILSNKSQQRQIMKTSTLMLIPICFSSVAAHWGGRSYGRRYRRHHSKSPHSAFDLLSEIFSQPLYDSSETILRHVNGSRRLNHQLVERENSFELSLEVPGVTSDDLLIELEDTDSLRIRGKRIGLDGTAEFEFDQVFVLDNECDIENIRVTLHSGILRVSAPKKDKVIRQLKINEDEPKDIKVGKLDPVGKEQSTPI